MPERLVHDDGLQVPKLAGWPFRLLLKRGQQSVVKFRVRRFNVSRGFQSRTSPHDKHLNNQRQHDATSEDTGDLQPAKA